MTIEHVTDHGDQGVALLISQFRGKPFIEVLTRALMEQVQELEDALWDLLINRAIDTAEGSQLDVIGRIVGQERGTLSEDSYRIWIKGRVLVNRSSGTTAQMAAIVNTLLPDGATLAITEYYPAAFQLEVVGSVPDWFGNALSGLILEAKALGVDPHVKWYNGAAVFRFAAVAGTPELASANGFGAGVFAAGSGGLADATVVPALDFSDPNNSQFVGVI